MSPIRLSRLESGMRTVLAFNEAFNRYDIEGMMQLISNDCVFENTAPAPDGTVYSGKEAISQYWQDFFNQFSRVHMEIEDAFGLGNHCIIRWRCEWVDETRNKEHIRGVDIFQVRSGIISEQLSYIKG